MRQDEKPRTLLNASTDDDGNVHMSFDGWLSVWDEDEGRVLLHSRGGSLCALVGRKRDGYLPTIRGGDGHGAYEPWTGFEDGELFVQGPCGRYLVRGYGPAGDEGCDEAEAVARYGGAHNVGDVQSFAAEYVEPEQQTLEGFAVYKRTAEGIRWIADLITLGHALAVARDMAETGRAPSPYNADDPAAAVAFQPAPGDCAACGGRFEEIDHDGLCGGCQKRNELYDALRYLVEAAAEVLEETGGHITGTRKLREAVREARELA